MERGKDRLFIPRRVVVIHASQLGTTEPESKFLRFDVSLDHLSAAAAKRFKFLDVPNLESHEWVVCSRYQ
jgi:hypothetical protein